MNSHLLLFNFYGEDQEKYKENNLSRALALCLKNDSVFMNNFLNEILDPPEFKELFYNEEDFTVEIDIQKRIANVDNTGTLKAIAITPLDLTESINSDLKPQQTDDPITDIYIRIKDFTIIIEVKKNHEDCTAQLLGQSQKLIDEGKVEKDSVNLKSLQWSEIIELVLATKRYLSSLNKNNIFLDDFIKYFEERFPAWFPVKTLDQLPFTIDENNPTFYHIYRRLEIIKRQTGFGPLKEFQDRTAIPVEFPWASEVHIGVEKNPRNNDNAIGVHIWPGDIKQQGQYLFSMSLGWTEQKNLSVGSEKYDLVVAPYLKFSHFTRGVAWIWLRDSLRDYAKVSHTAATFKQLAGRWWRDDWHNFENHLDDLFDFDWRNYHGLQWDETFINSNRQYFDLSFGFSVGVYLPYEKARQLENESIDNETPLLSDHIKKVIEEIQMLVEGR